MDLENRAEDLGPGGAEHKANLFSAVGIGARGAELILRRQELTLHNALVWGGRHLFLTAIRPEGRAPPRGGGAAVLLGQVSSSIRP